MGLSLSAKGAKSENDVGTGRPSKGRHLMMLKLVDETMDKKDQVIIDFESLASNVPDQRGKTITEYFHVTPKALPRLTRLALCIGLLQPDEEKDISFMPGVGRVLIVDVEDHKYKKEGDTEMTETVRVAYSGLYSLGNPDVAEFLNHPEVAAVIAQLRGGQPPAGSAPTTPTQTPPSGGGDKGKWGGLL